MYIDNLIVYNFDIEDDKKKSSKPKMVAHYENVDGMNVKKLARLLDDLSDSWSSSYKRLQIQVRFIPEGVDFHE